MEFDATLIIAVISFILFVLIMNKIYYAPIMRIMAERQEYVASNYSEVQVAKEKIASNTDIKNSKLEETRTIGRKIINDKSSELKKERDTKVHDARIESVNEVSRSKDEMLNKAYEAQDILINNTVDISKDISKIILGEEFSTASINGDNLKNTVERIQK